MSNNGEYNNFSIILKLGNPCWYFLDKTFHGFGVKAFERHTDSIWHGIQSPHEAISKAFFFFGIV